MRYRLRCQAGATQPCVEPRWQRLEVPGFGPEVEVDDGTRLADGRWLMSRSDSIWVLTPDSLGRAYIAPGHSATFTH